MQELRAESIGEILRNRIKGYERKVDTEEVGTVISVGDGIARVYGLDQAVAGELVEFDGGITGLVLNLEEDNVGVALFGEDSHLSEGGMVKRTGRIAEVPVGDALGGRVVDALGRPIDGLGGRAAAETRQVEVTDP